MIEDIYSKRKEQFGHQYNVFERKSKQISWFRIILTIISVTAVVFFANERLELPLALTIVAFFTLFGIMVNAHNKIRYTRDHFNFQKNINEDEILRLDNKITKFDPGKDFIDASHPYSGDLDIFGDNSLFQLINRTTTPLGRKYLANALMSQTAVEIINNRQDAVKELVDQIDWRQDFQATGIHLSKNEENLDGLNQWLGNDIDKPKNIIPAIILSIISIATLTTWLVGASSGIYLFIAILINLFYMRKVALKATDITGKSNKGLSILKVYKNLFDVVDRKNFNASSLKIIKKEITSDQSNAPAAIKKLVVIIDFLNNRSNSFFFLLNMFLLLDIYILNALIRWRARYGAQSKIWFDKLAELEYYSSLAGFAFSQPEYSFPKISKKDYKYKAVDMGHPLIHSSKRVTNTFEIDEKGKTFIITGSNMSGKSTFLRTVGINAILSFCGAPICAKSCNISYFDLFTSMRINDNLAENISSFYAELKRLRQLLDYLDSNTSPIMFLLDEILRGTNSQDRHVGAVALVKQLITRKCFGFVSTHDLALGELGNDSTLIKNFSFNSEIISENLIFNYKLTLGICNSFNASVLMKKMGIMNKV